jgi:hypothetical protein
LIDGCASLVNGLAGVAARGARLARASKLLGRNVILSVSASQPQLQGGATFTLSLHPYGRDIIGAFAS